MIDKRSLFKLSWGLRGRIGREQEKEHEVLLAEWKRRIAADAHFEPAAVRLKDGRLLTPDVVIAATGYRTGL